MKVLSTVIFALFSTTVFCQYVSTWTGGTPGKENLWSEARNWSNNKVPDEDTHVVIKSLNSGHNAMPLISRDVHVASLEIHSRGKLIIADSGSLTVGTDGIYSDGLSLYGGSVQNAGTIHFINFSAENMQYTIDEIHNDGGQIYLSDNMVIVSAKITGFN